MQANKERALGSRNAQQLLAACRRRYCPDRNQPQARNLHKRRTQEQLLKSATCGGANNTTGPSAETVHAAECSEADSSAAATSASGPCSWEQSEWGSNIMLENGAIESGDGDEEEGESAGISDGNEKQGMVKRNKMEEEVDPVLQESTQRSYRPFRLNVSWNTDKTSEASNVYSAHWRTVTRFGSLRSLSSHYAIDSTVC
jgi:hypothetical protein